MLHYDNALRASVPAEMRMKLKIWLLGVFVSVLVGTRFGPRERMFDAVIDKIVVKTLGECSPREIEHDNPQLRRPEEMASFLSQLYNRDVTEDETVTVIFFSEIRERHA